MAALRLPILGTDHKVILPAAGFLWFVAPFGRDSLIVSLKNILIYPDFARGSLDILGSLQAKAEDDYRDAEPGKIPHEIRYGELAHFKLIPHTLYTASQLTSARLHLLADHRLWFQEAAARQCTPSNLRLRTEPPLPVASPGAKNQLLGTDEQMPAADTVRQQLSLIDCL
jgi:glycogen debranching enzyme